MNASHKTFLIVETPCVLAYALIKAVFFKLKFIGLNTRPAGRVIAEQQM